MQTAAKRDQAQAIAFAVAFIGISDVKRISGFSKATILRKEKTGEMPAAVIADGNCKRWDLAEILAWRDKKFAERAERLKARAVAAAPVAVAA